MTTITAPGFYPEVTPAEYFAEPCPAPALTNSLIGILTDRSPLHAWHAHPALNPNPEERKSSAAQYRGELVHRLALGKGREFFIVDADDWRTKDAKASRDAAVEADLIPVLAPKFEEADAMAKIIRQRIADAVEGAAYQTEVVIAWQEDGVWCRAMLDVWCPSRLLALDVKTCADASDLAIDRAFARGYGRQDAWYRRGLEQLTAEHGRVAFKFLFVEADPPFVSRTAEATEGFRAGAYDECSRALATFAHCLKTGDWPGYGPRTVLPPNWLARQWAEAEIMEAA